MNNVMQLLGKNTLDNIFKVRPMENYRFYLIIEKGLDPKDEEIKIGFSNVSSFGYSVEVEEISVGGINDRKIALPKSVKASNVTCERGVADDNGLYRWINEIRDGKYSKRNMILMAFGGGMSLPTAIANEAASAATRIRKVWSFEDALPVKWEISGFNALGNEVVVEKLELNVESIKEITVK